MPVRYGLSKNHTANEQIVSVREKQRHSCNIGCIKQKMCEELSSSRESRYEENSSIQTFPYQDDKLVKPASTVFKKMRVADCLVALAILV